MDYVIDFRRKRNRTFEIGFIHVIHVMLCLIAIPFLLMFSRCAPVDDLADGDVGFIPSNVTEIVAVRHGETTWNSDGRIQVTPVSYIFWILSANRQMGTMVVVSRGLMLLKSVA